MVPENEYHIFDNILLVILIGFLITFSEYSGLGYWQVPFFSHIYPQIVPNHFSYIAGLYFGGVFSLIIFVHFH